MNYSTLKKGVAASLVALLGVTSLASAQDAPATTSTTKVFGGRAQYRTWSLGINAGILAPAVVTGGVNDFTNWEVNLGYGISLRKQFSHIFSLEGNAWRGTLSANNDGGVKNNAREYETKIQYGVDLRGVMTVGSIDFLNRENSVNFYFTAGYGLMAFNPKTTLSNGFIDDRGKTESHGGPGQNRSYARAGYVPVGAGVKFKVSERVSFNLAYTMNFVDADNVDGLYAGGSSQDKFSYGSAGLEFSLGSTAKSNLEWVNPIAVLYDELKDPTLRQELDALKTRVSNVEKSVEDLKRDTDGDGVADQFDKCAGTPAGTKVDGSGCPLPPPPATVAGVGADGKPLTGYGTNGQPLSGFETIQFEFNSSVLKTESYPTLDKLSSVLRENGGKVTVKGYASAEGTAAYNLKLSKDRASSVKTYLVNSGVNASAVTTKGLGEANPIASNDTEEGRIQNRRVETSRN